MLSNLIIPKYNKKNNKKYNNNNNNNNNINNKHNHNQSINIISKTKYNKFLPKDHLQHQFPVVLWV